jgi:omega-amidase
MKDSLRISLIQAATVWHDPVANRQLYESLARPLAGQTDLIILPETFTSGFSNEALAAAEGMDGPTVPWMQALARECGAVVTGSMQCRTDSGVFNRLLWVPPEGDIATYDKRHLFRMANEHERYAAGRSRLTVDLLGWRIRPLVCYDLRFPVYIRNRFGHEAADRFDYDLVLFVANWPAPRRHAWRTLLQARAIENLAYCAGVNRVGIDGNDVAYAGDSAVIDMRGDVMVECGAQPQVVTVQLSATALAAHRERFPAQLDADRFELLD